jgi:hypothetical protein
LLGDAGVREHAIAAGIRVPRDRVEVGFVPVQAKRDIKMRAGLRHRSLQSASESIVHLEIEVADSGVLECGREPR